MTEFRIVVASSRPMIQALFVEIGRQTPNSVVISPLPLDSHAVAGASEAVGAAAVAVVDVSVDPTVALEVCTELRAQHEALPITALACCHHAASAADLRPFLAAGVGGFLDGRLPPDETLHVLRGVARGEGVFHLQLNEESLTALLDGPDDENKLSDQDNELAALVALGLTDQEIGSRMYLSHHTVKHRIERLRRHANARNRVQLAAWAGRQSALWKRAPIG